MHYMKKLTKNKFVYLSATLALSQTKHSALAIVVKAQIKK